MIPSKWKKLLHWMNEADTGKQRPEMAGISDCPCVWFHSTLRFTCVLAIPVVWLYEPLATPPLLLPKLAQGGFLSFVTRE